MSSAASSSSTAANTGGIFSPTLSALLSCHGNAMVVSTTAGSSTAGTTLGSFMAGVLPPAPPTTPAAAAVRPAPVRQPAVAEMPAPAPFHFAHLLTIKLSAENYLYWRA